MVLQQAILDSSCPYPLALHGFCRVAQRDRECTFTSFLKPTIQLRRFFVCDICSVAEMARQEIEEEGKHRPWTVRAPASEIPASPRKRNKTHRSKRRR